MHRRTSFILRVIQIPLDILALFAAMSAAFYLRAQDFVVDVRPLVYNLSLGEYLSFVSWIIAFALLVFAAIGLYSTMLRSFWSEMGRVIYGCSVALLGVIILIFFQRDLFSSRFVILLAWGLSMVAVIFARAVMRMIERSLYARGKGTEKIVVVGNGGDTQGLLHVLQTSRSLGYSVVACVKATGDEAILAVEQLAAQHGTLSVLVADPAYDRDTLLRLQEVVEKVQGDFLYSPDRFSEQAAVTDVEDLGGYPLLRLKHSSLEGWGKVQKRALDIVVSILLITVFSPLYILIVIAIKLDSRGPILFSRLDNGEKLKRVGLRGELFSYFKFRSMKPKSHSLKYSAELAALNTRKEGPLTKIQNDPRITRVGKILRRFSLDELPEFFLVLKGDMSLVGPRPHEPEEVSKYTPYQKKVLRIKPGITGMAQVSGRSDLSFDDEVRLDLWYTQHWSLWLDIRILLKTPKAMFTKRTAV